MVRPTSAQRTLAYLANGDLPPWPLADRLLFASTIAAGCLAVAFGTWGALA
ncbi:hypothetical protein [Teichococcus aestuarii]|uniref:hypothetical protein n=1 Tax=Teichococcus aestuarii TaxID=568898 RepID=UPI0015E7EB4C|nr:hypothetical protein [Pseudoroseomonas aestuarii]